MLLVKIPKDILYNIILYLDGYSLRKTLNVNKIFRRVSRNIMEEYKNSDYPLYKQIKIISQYLDTFRIPISNYCKKCLITCNKMDKYEEKIKIYTSNVMRYELDGRKNGCLCKTDYSYKCANNNYNFENYEYYQLSLYKSLDFIDGIISIFKYIVEKNKIYYKFICRKKKALYEHYFTM